VQTCALPIWGLSSLVRKGAAGWHSTLVTTFGSEKEVLMRKAVMAFNVRLPHQHYPKNGVLECRIKTVVIVPPRPLLWKPYLRGYCPATSSSCVTATPASRQ